MKLTIHDACWEAAASPWSDQVLTAQVAWLKVIDDPARAFAVAQAVPTCNVIYRRVAPGDIEQLSDQRRHPEFGDARACAEMFVRLADVRAAANLWVEGANEVKLANADDARWYGTVEALRAQLLAERGLHAVIGNFATGNPEEDLFVAWLQSYLDHGGRRDALLGLHEYGAFGLPAAQDLHNLLRHRRLAERGGALMSGFRWAITECGLDRVKVGGVYVGGGWRAQGASVDEDAYWRYMFDYDAELERDTDVVCAAVFTYGDTARWRDYDLNDARSFNQALLDSLAAHPPEPSEPVSPTLTTTPSRSGDASSECDRSDVPDNWTHTVRAARGLNVRAAPEIADNIRCAMVNGKQVRALARQGDWMQIDWPLIGWCFAPNLQPRAEAPLDTHDHGPVEIGAQPARPKGKASARRGKRLTLKAGARFVDVSAWQEPDDLDWPALKWNGCSAAMIRVAAGTQTDPEWRRYADGAQRAGLAWFVYVYFSFLVGSDEQLRALRPALQTMTRLPTVVLDLEGANPSGSADGLRSYVAALQDLGLPLAVYTRQSWVQDNLPGLHNLLGDLPLIVANYRYPVGSQPALPGGWNAAAAWQHVAGEKVESDRLYWARYRTRSGRHLDESIVLESGLTVFCGA